jgi:predicted ATPase
MITKIKIENFKSIQNLDLELGRLNVFIGANGSGKSNILEGIAFGSAALQDELGNQYFKNRGIRNVDPKLFFSGFEDGEKNNQIKFSFDTDDYRSSIKTLKIRYLNFKKNIWEIKAYNESGLFWTNNVDDFQSLLLDVVTNNPDFNKIPEIFRFVKPNEFLNDFVIYAPENSCLRNFDDEGVIEPIGIKGEGLFKHLVEIFNTNPKLLDKLTENLSLLDWFNGFEIPNDLVFTEKRIKIKDSFLENGLQYFDQRSANEGFLYLLFYFTLFISEDTPKFFAIDNIDNAMNPKLGSELIRILAKLSNEHDKQVILTTHNPAILDGLNLEDDSQRLFVISRNKTGHTQAIRVPHRESEERLSTRFIRGSIGGLPKNF